MALGLWRRHSAAVLLGGHSRTCTARARDCLGAGACPEQSSLGLAGWCHNHSRKQRLVEHRCRRHATCDRAGRTGGAQAKVARPPCSSQPRRGYGCPRSMPSWCDDATAGPSRSGSMRRSGCSFALGPRPTRHLQWQLGEDVSAETGQGATSPSRGDTGRLSPTVGRADGADSACRSRLSPKATDHRLPCGRVRWHWNGSGAQRRRQSSMRHSMRAAISAGSRRRHCRGRCRYGAGRLLASVTVERGSGENAPPPPNTVSGRATSRSDGVDGNATRSVGTSRIRAPSCHCSPAGDRLGHC